VPRGGPASPAQPSALPWTGASGKDGTATTRGRQVTGTEGAACALPGRYRHDAFLYDSPDHLAAVAAPFLLDGLAEGEAAVVATSAATADVLRDAVSGHPQVHVLDRSDVYRARTPTAITTFRGLADEYAGGRSISGRPSATGSSGSATRRSSTGRSRGGRSGACASSTPSGCPTRCSTRRGTPTPPS
jgi:hypothetical protein